MLKISRVSETGRYKVYIMGVLLNMDLDTDLGASKKVYIRIENINLNRTFGKAGVAVTYWIDKSYSETFKHSSDRLPKGQISDLVVFYPDDQSLGEEVELPTYFEFDLKKPVQIKVPIYETKEVPEEVPYVSFDNFGRKVTRYKTITRKVKDKIGEKNDVSQVLDFSIESHLLSWCYGQIKAQLGTKLPIELLEDD